MAGRALRTLLFTDIVGSTRHVARLGDREWSALLERHDNALEAKVGEHGGRVMKKVGDGMFITFDSPGQAIRCAEAAVEAVRDLGLDLRAGVHSGECEVVGDDLRGMAVHIAERISSLAGPGEVFVSSTVRDLVAGSGIELVDRGPHVLKGVDGRWRVYGLPTPERSAAVQEARPAEEAEATLFGRARELEVLRRALMDARAGRGSLQLVAGEPGVGKTSLVDALVAEARDAGALALWGRCWEGGGAPAFWPWVQVIRGLAREEGPDQLRRGMGVSAGYLARLVPEIASTPDLQPSEVGSEEARFAFFDSLGRLLAETSTRRPVVIALDDVHLADEPSLLLLEYLAPQLREARVLVVGTYRRGEEGRRVDELLGRLGAGGHQLPLSGLAREDVEGVIEEATGAPPAAGVAKSIHEATEGNPFFVREVIRLLLARGTLEQPGSKLPVPEGVREAIRRRLEPLSGDTSGLLRLASVLGKEPSLPALERTSDVPRARMLELLDEAERHEVVIRVPGALGRYRFVHALVREVLYEALGASERVALHRRAADGLEALYSDDVEPHLAELAHHTLEAAPSGDVDRAIGYAQRAGHQAARLLAFEEASRHFEQALEALELSDAPSAEHRCDLLLFLGAAQRNAGDRERARETFRRAGQLARRLGDDARQAQAALGFAGRYWSTGVADPLVIELLEDALAGLGDSPGTLRAAVLGRLATELHYSPDRERSESLSEQALELARGQDDASALAAVLDARLATVWRPENLDERLGLTGELIELAERAQDRETALRGRAFRVTCLLEQGEVSRADLEIEAATRRAHELRRPVFVWHTTGLRALRAIMAGRFEEGEELADEALAAGRRIDEANAVHYHGLQIAAIRHIQGRHREIVGTIKSFVDRLPGLPGWRGVLALLYAELGREAEARREFELAAANDWADLPLDGAWMSAVCRTSQACAALGDVHRAEVLHGLLAPYAERNVVNGRVANTSIGAASFYLGLLLKTMGRLDEAEQRFEHALAFNEAMGARPWTAQTACDLGLMLRERSGPGDAERAAALLESSRATADELGMYYLARAAEG